MYTCHHVTGSHSWPVSQDAVCVLCVQKEKIYTEAKKGSKVGILYMRSIAHVIERRWTELKFLCSC